MGSRSSPAPPPPPAPIQLRLPKIEKVAPPPPPPAPPPPVTQKTAEVAQARDDERTRGLRRKGLSKSLLAGETGGFNAGLGAPQSLLPIGGGTR